MVPRPPPERPELDCDAAVPGSWETVRDAWSPFLPKTLRRMDRDAFVAALTASPDGRHADVAATPVRVVTPHRPLVTGPGP